MATNRTDQGALQRLGAWFGRRAAPRQARLYCVGAPRSGTHSIAAIFDRSLRSRHEPAFRSALRHVLAHHRGQLSFDDLRRFVRQRDAKLRLDVDSSHVNVFLAEALLAEFDEARFVLTLRDCFTWTEAAMNHTLNSRQWSAADRQYLEFYFDTGQLEYSPHDEVLRQHGLLSVDCYLAAWTRHNDRALAAIPPAKLLVVKTNEIAANLARIAEFAGVEAARIAPGFQARGRAKAKHGLLARVDAAYLADRAAAHCGGLMQQYFPGVHGLRDALAAESARG